MHVTTTNEKRDHEFKRELTTWKGFGGKNGKGKML